MENNIKRGFLYWDDYEDENLKKVEQKDTFSDSTEDED